MGFSGLELFTKIFPGCISAWKKLSSKSCLKKIFTPVSAKAFKFMFSFFSTSMSVTGIPEIFSMVMTFFEEKFSKTFGIYRREFSLKKFFVWMAFAASFFRSVSAVITNSYSLIKSISFNLRASERINSAKLPKNLIELTSAEILLSKPGRTIFTTTDSPSFKIASCT